MKFSVRVNSHRLDPKRSALSRRRCGRTLFVVAFLLAFGHGVAWANLQLSAHLPSLPWHSYVQTGGDLEDIHTITTVANVTVSDGKTYRVTAICRGPQRVVFHREYPDQKATLGIDGFYVWQYDGESEEEGAPFHAVVARGHQFHAALLTLPHLFAADPTGPPEPGEDGCACLEQRFVSEAGHEYRVRYRESDLRPLGMVSVIRDGPTIEFTYSDWNEVGSLRLPHRIGIDDGDRTFDYRFESIRFNEDRRGEFRSPFAVLRPAQQLMRLHSHSIDAHLASDPTLFAHHWADRIAFTSGGAVHEQSGEEAAAFMDRSLRGRRHSVYDDLELPRIEVSEDGTLGTVTVRVHAVGNRLDEDGNAGDLFEFVCAWTSVYRNEFGEWHLVSNISTFE